LFVHKKFVLFGDGNQAQLHRKAIASIGGEIIAVYDPPKYGRIPLREALDAADWAVIASPNYLHYEQIKIALRRYVDVIVEKPMHLPWEPTIDNDRINVVLPYAYLNDLPSKADMVQVKMVRDDAYYQTWRGDPLKTGGVFYHLFIHYVDLAIRLGASFDGSIDSSGDQCRLVDEYNLMDVNMSDLYAVMYNEIIFNDKGIKPKDMFFLDWIMENYCKSSFTQKYGSITINTPRR